MEPNLLSRSNVLKSHKVAEVMDTQFETVQTSATLLDIFALIERSRESYFIVVDRSGDMKGVLSFQDIRNFISQRSLDYLVIAADLVVPETVVLNHSDDLERAYNLFSQRDHVLLPVVRPEAPSCVIGVLRREDLIDYYNKRLIETLRN